MTDLKFVCGGARPDGVKLYRLEIDGRVAREGLTIDEVIEAINRADEASLGARHAPGSRQAVREPEVRR